MRKTLMIFLVLVLVCGCGTALAAQAVSAPREEILFQEHIFSGDPAAADGLTVQLKTGMRYKLNWENTVQFFRAGLPRGDKLPASCPPGRQSSRR